MTMDRQKEEEFLRMASENPGVLGREIPPEVLHVSVYDVEPTRWFLEFLETGHIEWVKRRDGRLTKSRDQVRSAAILLWLRACRLYNSHLLGRDDPGWDKPFFSDEGLSEGESF